MWREHFEYENKVYLTLEVAYKFNSWVKVVSQTDLYNDLLIPIFTKHISGLGLVVCSDGFSNNGRVGERGCESLAISTFSLTAIRCPHGLLN